jgi:FkbM family methyltransferase
VGLPIRLHAHHLNIINTFMYHQYRYVKAEPPIAARAGDVVIDGGGCWGDTALYFAHAVKPGGKVLSFEFEPENVAILRANLEINPDLKPLVRVVDRALWDRSGERLSFQCFGPGTSVVRGVQNGELWAETVCIDDLVKEGEVDRVDFIKLDVEAAELRTLQGATSTLTRFRPRLAISLYHSLDDFVTIPAFLKSLDLNYEFFLGHFTIHKEETVLFARALDR